MSKIDIEAAAKKITKKKKDQEEIDELKQQILPTKEKKVKYLSSGSSRLNLACSDRIDGAFPVGQYYLIVGKSDGGKSILCMSTLAEACLDKHFKDYQIIYDDTEEALTEGLLNLFPIVKSRIQPPAFHEEDSPRYSETVSEFFVHLKKALDRGPCIYILDSQDALTTDDEIATTGEDEVAYDKGKKNTSGSYGTERAKQFKRGIRQILHRLKKTESILIIVSQTIDNIGFGSQFNPETRSGGKSLGYYAQIQMWLAPKKTLTKKIAEKTQPIGVLSQIKIKRSRLNGKKPQVELPIYYSTGIDEIGSCIDFLVEEGHWRESKGRIDATDFEFNGFLEKLVKKIETEGREEELRQLVHKVWKETEEAFKVERKSRYS